MILMSVDVRARGLGCDEGSGCNGCVSVGDMVCWDWRKRLGKLIRGEFVIRFIWL